MCQWNTNAPGELFPKVLEVADCVTCITIASALSMIVMACSLLFIAFPCSSVLSTLPTIWCILSQIAFDCGFLDVVGWSWIPVCSNNSWNAHPVNSPPLSCTHFVGHGYQLNQWFWNICCMWFDVLFSIRMSSTRLVTGSIHIKALNSIVRSPILIVHGPIKLMRTSSQGINETCRGGNLPYPAPCRLCCRHVLQLYSFTVLFNCGWY